MKERESIRIEFKLKAVRLLENSSIPAVGLARDLGPANGYPHFVPAWDGVLRNYAN